MLSLSPPFIIVLQLFVLVISVLTALFEIQVEGPHGWASYLPTWRISSKTVQKFLNGKLVTGYHLYFYLLLFLLLHFPLLFVGWSWVLELTVLSCFFHYVAFWDFYWFVLNPYYGWKRFMRGNIWWFQSWIWRFPAEYYVSLFLSATFAVLRGFLATSDSLIFPTFSSPLLHLIFWFIGTSICVLITLMTIILFPHPNLEHPMGKDHIHPGESVS